jgi:hypothetical protein
MSTPPQPHAPQSWLDKLAQDRRRTSLGLYVLAALLAIIPLWLGIKYRAEYVDVVIMTTLLALVPLGAGLWNQVREPEEMSELDAARMLVLGVGGLFGLALVLLSAVLTYHWWGHLTGGMKTLQGSEGWRIWVDLLCLLGGLFAIFASLQLGRTEERSNPTLRRLVYGYNALLTGLLVLAILVVANVLASIHLKTPYDWTSQSIYSLSSRSESLLENLQKPTKVYVIMALENDDQRRVRALLNNCQSASKKLEVEYLSPELDRERVKNLMAKYKVSEREGLLLVYDVPLREESQFISARALHSGSGPAFMRNREPRFFKGESELMTAISFLAEGKKKPVIYFTQDNADELKLTDSVARELNTGLGTLRRRLEADNYTVKGLRFSQLEGAKSDRPEVVVSTRVPDDAALVVVPGPRQPLPKYAVDAIRQYMEPTGKDAAKGKGKLIVLFDVALTPDGDRIQRSGLEEMLDGYGVELGNDRVLQYRSRLAPLVRAFVNPAEDFAGRNPLPGVFREPFRFFNSRTVQPKTGGRPADVNYRADALLLIPVRDHVWAETNFRAGLDKLDMDAIEKQLRQNVKPLSIGVVVAEQAPALPHQPPAEESKPRLAVLGNVTMVSNAALANEAVFGRQYDLFQSLVGWLREKPASIGIEPKKQDVYELNAAGVDFNRMLYLPALLLLAGVIGLGTGVWVIRRR